MKNILTGYEVYNSSKELNVDSSIQKIQDSMFQRNPEKYGDFLGKLGEVKKALSAKLIPDVEERIELFKYVYFSMRLIDDVVDGDTNPPLEGKERKSMLESLLGNVIVNTKSSLYDSLNDKIYTISYNLGIQEGLNAAIQDIIISMNFDLDRILDDNKTRTREELQENFHKMDITGTIKGTALIFGIDSGSAIDVLEPLGEACRIMYNLRDFGEDILAFLVNIPEEDLIKFEITSQDLDSVREIGKDIEFRELPECIKKWFLQEISKIEILMRNYEYNKKTIKLKYTDILAPLLGFWRSGYVMKKRVLPETYEREIYQRIPKILEQVS